MTCGQWFLSFFISLFASIIAVLVALWIERFKKAKISLSVGGGSEIQAGDPAGRPQAKWLHVSVSNRNVPRLFAWAFTGDHAYCRAGITFHRLDGTKFINNEMEGRWSLSAEPDVIRTPVAGGTIIQVRNYLEGADLPPGETTPVDIAVRFNSEDECYGWNNESYATDWRNPKWRLPRGQYLVKVRVRSGGVDYAKVFLLHNDGSFQDFRLDSVPSTYREAERTIMTT